MKCQIITNTTNRLKSTNIGGIRVNIIAETPKIEDIKDILDLSSKIKIGEGDTGSAYNFKENVIKVFDKVKKTAKKSFYTEMENLSSLKNLILKSGDENYLHNTQKALYGFEHNKVPFLISSKVEGENPYPTIAPFNAKNLEAIVEILNRLDKGYGKYRFLAPDMRIPNIRITENNAGLLDFEYLHKIKLGNEKNLELTEKALPRINNSNFTLFLNESDTGFGTSNLRAFEYECLAPYLYRCPSATQAKETFRNYIKLKSEHHYDMAKHYEKLGSDFGDEIYKTMEAEELFHSQLLKDADKDILHTEAAKLQMYWFLRLVNLFSVKQDLPINLMQTQIFIDKEQNRCIQAVHQSMTTNDYMRTYYYLNAKNTIDEIANLLEYTKKTHKIPDHLLMQTPAGLLADKIL